MQYHENANGQKYLWWLQIIGSISVMHQNFLLLTIVLLNFDIELNLPIDSKSINFLTENDVALHLINLGV